MNTQDITLEKLFTRIGKDCCYISLIYPNAGTWIICTMFEDEQITEPTLKKALLKFEKQIAEQERK